jgi:hypothetical protein
MQGRSFAAKFATMQLLLLKSICIGFGPGLLPFSSLFFLTNKNVCLMFSLYLSQEWTEQ